jgi:hypothetical protein
VQTGFFGIDSEARHVSHGNGSRAGNGDVERDTGVAIHAFHFAAAQPSKLYRRNEQELSVAL